MNILSKSPARTKKIGEKIGKKLKKGDVIALIGGLGAGKTVITKGIMSGMEVRSHRITSPTFVLMNVYKGRLPVYHFDVYRLNSINEMIDLGYEDYFYGDGVTIVEWADKIEKLLPKNCIKIKINIVGEREREIKVNSVC
jgi:tRNA threonylcarbamoyladenosine biosynthesis protein TsaE